MATMESSYPVPDEETRPQQALTPPTSEKGTKNDVSSDLSDLELDDDEEDIEPDSYWDGGNIPIFRPVRCYPARLSPYC